MDNERVVKVKTYVDNLLRFQTFNVTINAAGLILAEIKKIEDSLHKIDYIIQTGKIQ